MLTLTTMDILKRFKICPVCGGSLQPVSVKSMKCKECGFEYFINASAAYVALIYDSQGRLLVVRRSREPARGTLDLPGGFAEPGETAEEGVRREVHEETNLTVLEAEYLFSLPNVYHYSNIDIPTLDMFYLCKVDGVEALAPADDAAECMWIAPEDIHTEQFGLRSVRWGLVKFLESMGK